MAYPPPLSRVMYALRRGWTPKRIEGRLKVGWPADPCIPMRVPIAKRPKRVDSRRGFGHFESGTVVGTAPSKRCIDTQAERKSRRLFARFKSALATARRIRHLQPHPRARENRPDLRQRHGGLLPRARGRVVGHAHPFRGPVLPVPARVEREPQRAHPPLPVREGRLQRPVGRGPAGHRRRDQRHSHEGPGPGNAQRGLVPRTRQGNLEGKPPEDECCTYKLNSGPP